ncbi:PLP-dependent aminotransferase family protein [Halolamina sp.]|jgi:2-aminoadipate transaminase|uniref:aminotransferase-like domain-containing protein n=1 Tax=Halolamina sp. TaxID=1940283 RepID=UPI0035643EB2
MTDRCERFDHLYTGTVRAALDEPGYGSWRSLSAPDAVSLSFGFPYPDSFPEAALSESLDAVLGEEGSDALQYGGGEYVDSLKAGILQREATLGVDATTENLLLTNGATHALDSIARTVLEPGDEIFAEIPTFMGSLSLFENFGVEVTGFPVDEDGLDVAALEAALTARRERGDPIPKLLYTIPNFQNPTGATLSRERRETLVALAAEYGFLIVEDDAYGELRFDGEDVTPMAALDDEGWVVRMGTFSKTIAPGVRTGWVVAHESLIEQFSQQAAGGTNTFTQSVLGRYFDAGHYEPVVEELTEAYAERRDAMLDSLAAHLPPGSEWTEPEGGFFVWVTLPEGVDTEDLLPDAAEEGITYLPGSHFYPGEGGERSLRLSFSHVSPEEMDRGVAALARATEAALTE